MVSLFVGDGFPIETFGNDVLEERVISQSDGLATRMFLAGIQNVLLLETILLGCTYECRSGNAMRNMLPFPGLLSTSIVPP